jgi:hypothetical protein
MGLCHCLILSSEPSRNEELQIKKFEEKEAAVGILKVSYELLTIIILLVGPHHETGLGPILKNLFMAVIYESML